MTEGKTTIMDKFGNVLDAVIVNVRGEQKYTSAMFKHINQIFPKLNEFQSRSTDVWICAYHKSGTHWINEILWLMLNNRPSETSKMSYMLEACQEIVDFNNLLSPRILNTHIPFKYIPQQIKESKIVYIIRNPLSVALSYYYHTVNCHLNYTGTPETFIESFSVIIWSWFEHVIDAYKLSQTRSNILLVFYEEMLEDPAKAIKEISQFLGCDVLGGTLETIVTQTSLQSMKDRFSASKDHSVGSINGTVFTRKGEAAEWKQHVTHEFLENFMKTYDSELKDYPELKKRIQI